ncbi:hypothetical protein PMI18_01388 [Pseudomonas sp. GM102]|uniref:hypothetical protein n=1 Tax=Pseudomonas sp. GM102 TaxID=1144321 RepID=UPI00026F8933|nr:hypothetical protein [Pseudomonas sp. GM102]EJM04303.1 hypothetical protein PMI18_01388 [Pseudomonas sp. GM102]
MIVKVEFEVLNTFDCTYGEFEEGVDRVRVFVKGGLVLPHGGLSKIGNEFCFFGCAEDKSENVERLFPKHYIYDPLRKVEYVEWVVCDGILRARTSSDEWTQYENKSDSLYAMHEYVGGCWFVFEEVVFFRRMIDVYTPDRQSSSGKKYVQEFGDCSRVEQFTKKFVLEGVLDAFPGPGWMSWEICSKTFYIEIPD